MEPVYRSLEIAAHTLAAVRGLRLSVVDEHNVPSEGGAVIAVNHTGYVDFLPAALGVYRAGRRVRYMIKSEMMDVRVVRFLIEHTHTVPVDRSAGAEAYATAVQRLREGFLLGVYPEATISRSFEKELETGAVRMAGEAGVPIVPCIVWGSQRQWSKGTQRRMGRRRIPVSVRFGTPLHVEPTADPLAETQRLKAVMSDLLDATRADYPEHPRGADWVPAAMGGSAPTLAEAHEIEVVEEREKAAARAAKCAENA